MESKTVDTAVLQQALTNTRQAVLDARTEEGIWSGSLSSSPLATAVAIFALHQVDADEYRSFIDKGLHWLAEVQQPDGSWGDAEQLDPGNLSTTLLCYATIYATDASGYEQVASKARGWIEQKAGGTTAEEISTCLYQVYGKDRTFAVPILTMCALAGVLGSDGWRYVKPLPFELAALPRFLFRWLKLNVVSYALPALIAIGQVKFHFDRSANPVSRLFRSCLKEATLNRLEKIQPTNGGFLEATPLTSFVVLSLAAMGLKEYAVVKKGVEFIVDSVRRDGSWPIDTNLSIWVTSLSVTAISASQNEEILSLQEKKAVCDWYLGQQFRSIHPYTGALPGGWGWTNLPGSVPDADDTAGALVALNTLGVRTEPILDAVSRGLRWLIELQNTDGGVPTFCRGWGRLEFDRSCPDITAHAVLAWHLWKDRFDPRFKQQMQRAIERGVSYLKANQSPDGLWLPLWFGNPASQSKKNPVYGTAKVLHALNQLGNRKNETIRQKGAAFLLAAQNDDAGWGAEKGAVSTIEETGLAIQALQGCSLPDTEKAVNSGLTWLIEKTRQGSQFDAAPMGLYFAKLWYAERLYPMIFSLGAFQSAL